MQEVVLVIDDKANVQTAGSIDTKGIHDSSASVPGVIKSDSMTTNGTGTPNENPATITTSNTSSLTPLMATQPCPVNGYRLVYLNIRGRAELIRLLFKAAEVDFQDDRIEYSEWPELKEHTPTGFLPYLVTPEGELMVQSMAIARYLARKFQLYGQTEMDVYRIERAIGQLQDLADEAFKIVVSPTDQRETALTGFRQGTGKIMLTLLEKFLRENLEDSALDRASGYFGGEKASVADLFSVAVVDWLSFNFSDLLDSYTLLVDHYHQLLNEFPLVKSYLTNGPKCLY